jgi:hypothetical protein
MLMLLINEIRGLVGMRQDRRVAGRENKRLRAYLLSCGLL